MRLYPVLLREKVATETTDKLGNVIHEIRDMDVLGAEGRKSIFTNAEIALDARIVTQNIQKAVTTISRADLSKAFLFVINGESFTITDIKGEDDDRWRVIYLKSYGK